MRSSLTLISCLLLAGCDPEIDEFQLVSEPPPGPLFCDVYQARVFTQAEVDVRAARWPNNLRLDYADRLTWDEECAA